MTKRRFSKWCEKKGGGLNCANVKYFLIESTNCKDYNENKILVFNIRTTPSNKIDLKIVSRC